MPTKKIRVNGIHVAGDQVMRLVFRVLAVLCPRRIDGIAGWKYVRRAVWRDRIARGANASGVVNLWVRFSRRRESPVGGLDGEGGFGGERAWYVPRVEDSIVAARDAWEKEVESAMLPRVCQHWYSSLCRRRPN
jgi:hypothetical protein